MIVYVRLGTLIRCVLCTVVIAIAIATTLVHPTEPDRTSSPESSTTSRVAK